MTLDEFERWNGGEPGVKYELVDGIVVPKTTAMSPESIRHLRFKEAGFDALRDGVRSAGVPCRAFADSATIRTMPASARVPDGVVHCGEWDDDSVYLDNPIIMLEVVSPTSGRGDTSLKVDEYFGLASVEHYLIVHPDRHKLVWHRRDGDGIATRIVADGTLVLDPPGIELNVDAVLSPTD